MTTKKLMMTLRKSFKYKTVVRNVNRAFNTDVNIELFYDTYVDVENHKHAFFCQASLRIRTFLPDPESDPEKIIPDPESDPEKIIPDPGSSDPE